MYSHEANNVSTQELDCGGCHYKNCQCYNVCTQCGWINDSCVTISNVIDDVVDATEQLKVSVDYLKELYK